MAQVTEKDVAQLRAALGGGILLPGDDGYDEARRVWNADIDRRPALIARCTSSADVAACVAFATGHGLELSVRCGSHGTSGHAVVDGGLVIDLTPMNQVVVDPVRRTAHVGGGALLGDFLAAAQEHGLATPVGAISHTGLGGLTLGGGMGWLTRKHGLTIDNLVSCEVVTADGRVLRASDEEHPDLFWALRGGGGNFGVVTDFELALHPVGPQVQFALLFWGLDTAKDALRNARGVAESLPADTNVILGAVSAPEAPFVPAEHQHAPGAVALVTGFGSAEEHAEVLERLRSGVPPLFELVTPMPYVAVQQLLDEANAWGQYDYDKGIYLEQLADAVVDVVLESLPGRASPGSVVLFYRLDAAYSAVDDAATAFSGGRSPRYGCFLIACCQTREQLAVDREWVRALHRALEPYAADGTYVNVLSEDEDQARVRRAYGKVTYDRLAEVKQAYDPTNTFRHNANIAPAGAR